MKKESKRTPLISDKRKRDSGFILKATLQNSPVKVERRISVL